MHAIGADEVGGGCHHAVGVGTVVAAKIAAQDRWIGNPIAFRELGFGAGKTAKECGTVGQNKRSRGRQARCIDAGGYPNFVARCGSAYGALQRGRVVPIAAIPYTTWFYKDGGGGVERIGGEDKK